MRIQFRTNLDLERCEKWPEELPEVPRAGDLVQSGHEWVYGPVMEMGSRYRTRLELEVVRVVWVHVPPTVGTLVDRGDGLLVPDQVWRWLPRVELHLPPCHTNLTSFYEWYGKITGKGKSAYI